MISGPAFFGSVKYVGVEDTLSISEPFCFLKNDGSYGRGTGIGTIDIDICQ